MQTQTIVFGGGCFWCVEAVFSELRGVMKTEVGYAGGTKENPTYEEVCSGKTGHAEVVKVTYSPAEISFRKLLEVFFSSHDPTTMHCQGADVGAQYRSAIFYADEEQKKEIERYIKEVENSGAYQNQIVTEVKPLGKFYRAEEYHQKYFKKNPDKPYCQIVISPKMEKLIREYKGLLKNS